MVSEIISYGIVTPSMHLIFPLMIHSNPFFSFYPRGCVVLTVVYSVCRAVLSRKQRRNTAQQHRTHRHSTAERSLLRHRGLPRSRPGVGQSLLQQNLFDHLVDREHQTFFHKETQVPISCGRRTSGVKV